MSNKTIRKYALGAISFLTLVSLLYMAEAYFFLDYFGLKYKVTPFTMLEYYLAYSDGQSKKLTKILELSVFGPPFLLGVFYLFVVLAQKDKRTLHGDARFATLHEVKKFGLIVKVNRELKDRMRKINEKLSYVKETLGIEDKKGRLTTLISTLLSKFGIKLKASSSSKLAVPDKAILLGKFKDNYLFFQGMQFAYLSAPTRSGKGVGVVIPNCLTYSDSMVVVDIKYENFEITSGFRSAVLGQEVYRFSPFDENGATHCYNPLDYISQDKSKRISDINAIGGALYKLLPEEKDPFWKDNAKTLFRGICLMVLENPKFDKTMGQIARIGTGMGQELKEYLAREIYSKFLVDGKVCEYSPACKSAIIKIITTADNTLSGIISQFLTPLDTFENAYLDAATSRSDFNLRDVRKKKMTIYVSVQPKFLDQASVILNLFFSQLIAENTVELPSAENPYQCLMLLDEFTALGKISIMTSSIAYMAGYNMRPFIIIQNREQLESYYGKSDAATLLANFATLVMYAPSVINQEEAQKASELLGYQTFKSKSSNRSTPAGFGGGHGSSGVSISDQRRALMLPQEIQAMAFEEEIVKVNNSKPVFCNKILYFKDKDFVSRANLPVPAIPVIDITDFEAQLSQKSYDLQSGLYEKELANFMANQGQSTGMGPDGYASNANGNANGNGYQGDGYKGGVYQRGSYQDSANAHDRTSRRNGFGSGSGNAMGSGFGANASANANANANTYGNVDSSDTLSSEQSRACEAYFSEVLGSLDEETKDKISESITNSELDDKLEKELCEGTLSLESFRQELTDEQKQNFFVDSVLDDNTEFTDDSEISAQDVSFTDFEVDDDEDLMPYMDEMASCGDTDFLGFADDETEDSKTGQTDIFDLMTEKDFDGSFVSDTSTDMGADSDDYYSRKEGSNNDDGHADASVSATFSATSSTAFSETSCDISSATANIQTSTVFPDNFMNSNSLTQVLK